MKKTLITAVLMAVTLAACLSTSTTPMTARQSAHQSALITAKSVDLLMTTVGDLYKAGGFGPVGSEQAEKVRQTASKISIGVSASLNGWLAALDAGRDPQNYMTEINTALLQLATLLAQKHSGVQVVDTVERDATLAIWQFGDRFSAPFGSYFAGRS